MSASKNRVTASQLIGSTPAAAVRAISLPVHHCLASWADHSKTAAPPIVLVACSGGADSMALAVSAIDSAHRLGLPIHSVTVDHGLRPGSADEAATVAAYLQEMGACAHRRGPQLEGPSGTVFDEEPIFHLSPDLEGHGPEGDARTLRYGAIARLAHELYEDAGGRSTVLILLGHTMDDQAETVLLRLARGSGVGSLQSMAHTRPFPLTVTPGQGSADASAEAVLLRPLLGVRRAHTLAFCQELGCPTVDDPTNAIDGPWTSADGSPLRRSAIRHRVLPAIGEALAMDPVPALARTAELARDDNEALEHYARQSFTTAVRPLVSNEGNEGGGLALDIETIASLPRALRRRVLRHACVGAGVKAGNLSAEHLMRVDELMTAWKGQGPLHLPQLQVWRTKDSANRPVLCFAPKAPGS